MNTMQVKLFLQTMHNKKMSCGNYEEELQKRFPDTEILIHVDPEGQTDRETLLPQEITEQAT